MSGSSDVLVWVHEDALRDDHPSYAAAPDTARRIFIWDAADFEARGYALKRLLFLHECLQDMQVEVIAGETVTVLSALAPSLIYTAATPDPARRVIIRNLSKFCRVEERADTPLTNVPANTDMGRFFRFWNHARRSVMSLSSEMADGQSVSDTTKTRA